MLTMTCDIEIGAVTGIKPYAVTWSSTMAGYIERCRIELPLQPYTKSTGNDYADGRDAMSGNRLRNVQSTIFWKGDRVSVAVGYDNKNNPVFEGFVSDINYAERLVIECEGYVYQLRDRYINWSHKSATSMTVLQEVVRDTEILISPKTANINLGAVSFKNAPATKVLEWFAKECACQVSMEGRYLYVGASRYVTIDPKREIKRHNLRVGYDVISTELQHERSEEVQINIVAKEQSGSVKRVKSETTRYSNVKEVRVRAGLDPTYLNAVAKELQGVENSEGYRGSATLFLTPHVRKSDSVQLIDDRFPERSGGYIVEAVEGSYDSNGGRQRITMRYYDNRG